MNGCCFEKIAEADAGRRSALPLGALADVVPSSAPETDLQFFARRAWEESRLARQAVCPRAAASHSYLASAYSAEVAKELAKTAELEELLLRMS